MTQRFHYVKPRSRNTFMEGPRGVTGEAQEERGNGPGADRYNAGAGGEPTAEGWARLDSNQGPRDYESPALTD